MANLLSLIPEEIVELDDRQFIYNVLSPIFFDKEIVSDFRTSVIEANKIFPSTNTNNITDLRFFDNIDLSSISCYLEKGSDKVKMNNLFDYDLRDRLITSIANYNSYIQNNDLNWVYSIFELRYSYENERAEIKKEILINQDKLSTATADKKKILSKIIDDYSYRVSELDDVIEEIGWVFEEIYNAGNINDKFNSFILKLSAKYKIKSVNVSHIVSSSKLKDRLSLHVPSSKYNKLVMHKNDKGETLELTDNSFSTIIESLLFYSDIIREIDSNYKVILDLFGVNDTGYFSIIQDAKRTIYQPFFKDIKIDNRAENLEIIKLSSGWVAYLTFAKNITMTEDTVRCWIDGIELVGDENLSTGESFYGFTIEKNWITDTSNNYKILFNPAFSNWETEPKIEFVFDICESKHIVLDKFDTDFETTEFYDNFKFYGKDKETGAYVRLTFPMNMSIDIHKTTDRFLRSYSFNPLNRDRLQYLMREYDGFLVSYNTFGKKYTPLLLTNPLSTSEFHKVYITHRYISRYVPLDRIFEKNVIIPLYEKFNKDEHSTCFPIIVSDTGILYIKNYSIRDFKMVLNPHHEILPTSDISISYDVWESIEQQSNVFRKNKLLRIECFKNIEVGITPQIDLVRNMIFWLGFNKDIVVEQITKVNKVTELSPFFTGFYNSFHEGFGFKTADSFIPITQTDIANVGGKLLIDAIDTPTIAVRGISTIRFDERNINNVIYLDTFDYKFCCNINGVTFLIPDLYFLNNSDLQDIKSTDDSDNFLFCDIATGIIYVYDHITKKEFAIDNIIADSDKLFVMSLINSELNATIRVKLSDTVSLDIHLEKYNRQAQTFNKWAGLDINSFFYVDQLIPGNDNFGYGGRENITTSIQNLSGLRTLGNAHDENTIMEATRLISQEYDVDLEKSVDHNMFEEEYINFANSMGINKGIELEIKKLFKKITDNMEMSPIFLILTNKNISEWRKVNDGMDVGVVDTMLKKLVNVLLSKNQNDSTSLIYDTKGNNSIIEIMNQLESKCVNKFLQNNTYEEFLHFAMLLWVEQNIKLIQTFINANPTFITPEDLSLINQPAIFLLETLDRKYKVLTTLINTIEGAYPTKKDSFGNIIFERMSIFKSSRVLTNKQDYDKELMNIELNVSKKYEYKMLDLSTIFGNMSHSPFIIIKPMSYEPNVISSHWRLLDIASLQKIDLVEYDDKFNEFAETGVDITINFAELVLSIILELTLTDTIKPSLLEVETDLIKYISSMYIPMCLIEQKVESVEDIRGCITSLLMEYKNNINGILEGSYIPKALSFFGEDVSTIYNNMVSTNTISVITHSFKSHDKFIIDTVDRTPTVTDICFRYMFYKKQYGQIAEILSTHTENVLATSMIDLSLTTNVYTKLGSSRFSYSMYDDLVDSISRKYIPMHTIINDIRIMYSIFETKTNLSKSNISALEADQLKIASVTSMDDMSMTVLLHYKEIIRAKMFESMSGSIGMEIPSEQWFSPSSDIYDYGEIIKPGSIDWTEYGMDGYSDDLSIPDNWDYAHIVEPGNLVTAPLYSARRRGALFDSVPDTLENVANSIITEWYHQRVTTYLQDDTKAIISIMDFDPSLIIAADTLSISKTSIKDQYFADITYDIPVTLLRDLEVLDVTYDANPYDTLDYGSRNSANIATTLDDLIYFGVNYYFTDVINVKIFEQIFAEVVSYHGFANPLNNCKYTEICPYEDEPNLDPEHKLNYGYLNEESVNALISVQLLDTLRMGITKDLGLQDSIISDMNDSLNTIDLDIYNSDFFNNVVISDNIAFAQSYKVTNSLIISEYPSDKPDMDIGGLTNLKEKWFSGDSYIGDNVSLKLTDVLRRVTTHFTFRRIDSDINFDPYTGDWAKYFINEKNSELNNYKLEDRIQSLIGSTYTDVLKVKIRDTFSDTPIVNNNSLIKYIGFYEDVVQTTDAEFLFCSVSEKLGTYQTDIRSEFYTAPKKYNMVLDDSLKSTLISDPLDAFTGDMYSTTIVERLVIGRKAYGNDKSNIRMAKDYLHKLSEIWDEGANFRFKEVTSLNTREILSLYFKTKDTLIANAKDTLIINRQLACKDTGAAKIKEKMYYGDTQYRAHDSIKVSLTENDILSTERDILRDRSALIITDSYDIDINDVTSETWIAKFHNGLPDKPYEIGFPYDSIYDGGADATLASTIKDSIQSVTTNVAYVDYFKGSAIDKVFPGYHYDMKKETLKIGMIDRDIIANTTLLFPSDYDINNLLITKVTDSLLVTNNIFNAKDSSEISITEAFVGGLIFYENPQVTINDTLTYNLGGFKTKGHILTQDKYISNLSFNYKEDIKPTVTDNVFVGWRYSDTGYAKITETNTLNTNLHFYESMNVKSTFSERISKQYQEYALKASVFDTLTTYEGIVSGDKSSVKVTDNLLYAIDDSHTKSLKDKISLGISDAMYQTQQKILVETLKVKGTEHSAVGLKFYELVNSSVKDAYTNVMIKYDTVRQLGYAVPRYDNELYEESLDLIKENLISTTVKDGLMNVSIGTSPLHFKEFISVVTTEATSEIITPDYLSPESLSISVNDMQVVHEVKILSNNILHKSVYDRRITSFDFNDPQLSQIMTLSTIFNKDLIVLNIVEDETNTAYVTDLDTFDMFFTKVPGFEYRFLANNATVYPTNDAVTPTSLIFNEIEVDAVSILKSGAFAELALAKNMFDTSDYNAYHTVYTPIDIVRYFRDRALRADNFVSDSVLDTATSSLVTAGVRDSFKMHGTFVSKLKVGVTDKLQSSNYNFFEDKTSVLGYSYLKAEENSSIGTDIVKGLYSFEATATASMFDKVLAQFTTHKHTDKAYTSITDSITVGFGSDNKSEDKSQVVFSDSFMAGIHTKNNDKSTVTFLEKLIAGFSFEEDVVYDAPFATSEHPVFDKLSTFDTIDTFSTLYGYGKEFPTINVADKLYNNVAFDFYDMLDYVTTERIEGMQSSLMPDGHITIKGSDYIMDIDQLIENSIVVDSPDSNMAGTQIKELSNFSVRLLFRDKSNTVAKDSFNYQII